ncbi:hypothetical protein H0G86_005086 [Trichoderma simmonsii]|uniref:Zn(2)-C6 fungal-type domain-containing protein n=1 Tax=Trichoderma simmonsii TaxID=1491479 RepID=A0A8G0L8U8_9HYPO|nr:hypothetical protein H0G86_005086 [Trichoderma simmonsii]
MTSRTTMAADKEDDDVRAANDHQEQSSGNTKRARISQACEPCRAKKCKCDGQYPICGSCRLDRSQVCLYDPHPKKRGLPAGLSGMLDRQVRILELICATLYDRIEHPAAEEDPPRAERTGIARLRDVTGSETATGVNMAVTSARSDNDRATALLDRWRACPISGFVENASKDFAAFERFWQQSDNLLNPLLPPRVLPLVQIHPMEEMANHIRTPTNRGTIRQPSQFVSESLPFVGDDSQKSNSSLHMPPNLLSGGNNKICASNNFMDLKVTAAAPSPAICSLSHMSSPIPKCTLPYHTLPQNTTRLLNVYFTYTHTWLPMVDKFKLVSFAHSFSATSSSYSTAARGRLAILWAIIAFVSFQVATRDTTGDSISLSERDRTAPEAAYRIARALIPTEDQRYELEHVQALLLLGLINIGKSAWATSWLLIGMAGRIAQDMDLESKFWPQNSCQRRTFLACIVVDGLISAYLNRRPHLHKRSTEVPATEAQDSQYLEEEGWEEWSLWDGSKFAATGTVSSGQDDQFPLRSLNTFNQLLRLMHIVNDIISLDYSGKSLQTIEKVHIGFSKQLEKWRDGLEAHCALISPNDVDIRPPHVLNLHMVFCSTVCLLRHRLSTYQHNNHNSTASTTPFLDLEFQSSRHHIDTLLYHYRSRFTLTLAPPTFALVADLVFQHTGGATVNQAPLSNYMEEMKEIWMVPASSVMNGNVITRPELDDLNEQHIAASEGHETSRAGSSGREENINTNSTNVSQTKSISRLPITDFFDKFMSDATSLPSSAYSLDMSPCYPNHQYEGHIQQQTAINDIETSSCNSHQAMMTTTLAAASQQQNELSNLQPSHLPEPTASRLNYMNSFGGNLLPTPKVDSGQSHLSNAYSNPINPVLYNNTISMATSNVNVRHKQTVQIPEYPSLSSNKAIVLDPVGLANASKSESNLAALDAIDWNDDSFMKNLGYHTGHI